MHREHRPGRPARRWKPARSGAVGLAGQCGGTSQRWPTRHGSGCSPSTTNGSWSRSLFATPPARRPWSPRAHRKPSWSAASTCLLRHVPRWRQSSAQATGSSRWRRARPPAPGRRRLPTNMTCNSWDFSSSSIRRNRTLRESLRRLAALGIAVKVVTGDNPTVAIKVCHDLGLADGAALTGADLAALDDAALAAVISTPPSSPGSAPRTRPGSSASSDAPAAGSPSSATGSTTRSPCTPPMSASPSTRAPTSPRTRPT